MTSPLRGATGAQVDAQAKVNLRLKILAREASGFHQLETLFLRLQLADTVRVRRTSSVRTLAATGDVDQSLIGPPERNLAWRAADAYFAAAGWSGGFDIELVKRIPIGGGMGGGSADAGGVLRILDAIAPEPLGPARLLAIAATLGADVPFLASEHAYALAWGRGERMLALDPPEPRSVVLVIPPISVNTAAAYGWLADERAKRQVAATDAEVLELEALSDWPRLAAIAVNDFQPVVSMRHPVLSLLSRELHAETVELAMMSGSGSVFFQVMKAGIAVFDTGAAPDSPLRILHTETALDVEPVRPWG